MLCDRCLRTLAEPPMDSVPQLCVLLSTLQMRGATHVVVPLPGRGGREPRADDPSSLLIRPHRNEVYQAALRVAISLPYAPSGADGQYDVSCVCVCYRLHGAMKEWLIMCAHS